MAKARACLGNAYAPYSDFAVAAAVTDHLGRVFTGVNIENASYSLTICAERVALFAAVAAGATQITAIAITAKKALPITPCGACRQVMAEFCRPEASVFLDTGHDTPLKTTLGELLPLAFTAAAFNSQ